MNNSFKKPFYSLFPIFNFCHNRKLNVKRTLYIFSYKNNIKILKPMLLMNQIRQVTGTSLAKANDSNITGPKIDRRKSILNDDDFQSILSDFSRDFGVNSDSEQILDEIRQSLDEPSNDSGNISQNNEENCNSPNVNEKLKDIVNDSKFKEFSEYDAVIIPSHEELQSQKEEYNYHIDEDTDFQFYPKELKRGVTGVYDIDELIEVLRKENLDGVTTISIPEDFHYADFLVIATAKSLRHSKAVCEHIIKLYKMKKNSADLFVNVEGEKNSDWKAIDMGNIVLHIFLEETRALYDIESLWLFDSEFDKGGNQKPDPLYNAIEEQMAFFNALKVSNPKEPKKKEP